MSFLRTTILLFASPFLLTAGTASADGLGGGRELDEQPPADCISKLQRQEAEAKLAKYRASRVEGGVILPPTLYPFYPQAGEFWGDIFPNNFVDLDPSAGIQDYECTGYTYDTHQGIDSDITTWTRKDIGVPVYAALPGTVVAIQDGNFDEQTTWDPNNQANYVIIDHGGEHTTWYWHLKNGSVSVSPGETVQAGQQIGLTASSGYSTGPHLHFESRLYDSYYEPFAGACRPGDSGFENQPAFRRDLYLREFAITTDDLSVWAGPPVDTDREAYFGTGVQPIRFWTIAQNFPAECPWRVRFIRPDDSVRYDSGAQAFANSNFYRTSYWWWNYNINFDVTGTWIVELTLDGDVVANAPFEVVETPESGVNRPPLPAEGLSFIPPSPNYTQAVRCQVEAPIILRDPDYDVVRYRFLWTVDGDVRRDVTIAATSDMLPAYEANAGQVVECTVTASDGITSSTQLSLSRQLLGTGPYDGWVVQ
ncbi:M23 family metallopeptidase [bacterium]|nr:M23 family metallopeptidase [bacterium]